MASPMQEQALRQTMLLQQDLTLSRLKTPPSFPGPGMSAIRSSGRNQELRWEVSHETISGDFALDDILATALADRAASKLVDGGWLKEYLNNKPGDNAGFSEYLTDATLGPGNIAGNANSARQAAAAFLGNQKLGNATKILESGKAQAVKLNGHTTLYNANTSGKGPPRLKVAINNMSLKNISAELLGDVKMGNNGIIRASLKNVKSMTNLISSTNKLRLLNTKVGGGALTVASTVALDLYDTVSRDTQGHLHWNTSQFIESQKRNQSANAVGVGVGIGVEIGAVALFGLAAGGAPVILIGLGAGIVAQALWNKYHVYDKIGHLAE